MRTNYINHNIILLIIIFMYDWVSNVLTLNSIPAKMLKSSRCTLYVGSTVPEVTDTA